MKKVTLKHADLLNVKPSWYWMVSDRVAEFDDVLGRPIANIDLVRAQTRRWFEDYARIDPNGSDTDVSDLIRDLLATLAKGGEDVMRLYHWGLAIDPDMLATVSHYQEEADGSVHPVVNDNFHAKNAQKQWIETLRGWRPEMLDLTTRPGPDLRDDLYASFKEVALTPYLALKARVKADNRSWVKKSERRTDWDQYLWDQWFGEFGYEPARVVVDGYLIMRTREWWREIAPTLSAGQEKQIVQWYTQDAALRSSSGKVPERAVMSLKDALMIDQMPAFYTELAVPPAGATPLDEGAA